MMGAACAKIMLFYDWAIVTSTVDKTSFQNSVSLKLHNLGVIITLPRHLGVAFGSIRRISGVEYT